MTGQAGAPLTVENIVRAALPAVALLALLLAGCGSSSHHGPSVTTQAGLSGTTQAAGSTPDVPGTVNVVMKSLAFNPTVIHARVGGTVVWSNEDSSPHNVTYVSGPRFRSSRPKIRPGTSFSLRLTEPGTIRYYCSIHPWMTAAIVVSR